MITVYPSPTADTRTCAYRSVDEITLKMSSQQHIGDVFRAMGFFCEQLEDAAERHDFDKLSLLKQFHHDFQTGFAETTWWDNHRRVNRHHLNSPDGVPQNVNLIDVLEFVSDCVMAGMARSGTVTPLHLPDDLLQKAFQNTVRLLQSQVRIDNGEE